MSGKNQHRSVLSSEQRKRRTQQIIFSILAIVIILSWIISLIAPF
jgi:hypothetical protein